MPYFVGHQRLQEQNLQADPRGKGQVEPDRLSREAFDDMPYADDFMVKNTAFGYRSGTTARPDPLGSQPAAQAGLSVRRVSEAYKKGAPPSARRTAPLPHVRDAFAHVIVMDDDIRHLDTSMKMEKVRKSSTQSEVS
ncbi:hypothetical protein [Streptomyces sp. NPDC005533]|uniref:hypothetical protein n=1 Tax=Streptomyces sp. NPDC005533 TaxID=3364723 RepID=UPI0036BB6266